MKKKIRSINQKRICVCFFIPHYLDSFFALDKKPLSCPVPLLLIVNSAFSSRTSALLFLILLSFFFGSLPSMSSSSQYIMLGMRFSLAILSKERRKPKKRKLHFPTRSFLFFFFFFSSLQLCVEVYVRMPQTKSNRRFQQQQQ